MLLVWNSDVAEVFCKGCVSVYLPAEMEAALSAAAESHPFPAGHTAHSWTAFLSQPHGEVEG